MVREWMVEKELTAQEKARSKQVSGKDTGKEASQKEAENHTTDSPSPEKEEGKAEQEPPQSKYDLDKGQNTDMGIER